MISPLLLRLDEVEQLDYELGMNSEALDIMEAFAQGPEELSTLVERYASSRSANVAASLALLLAEKAEDPTPGLYELVFSFIEKSRYKYEPSSLQLCLRVLFLLLMHDCIWQPDSQVPDLLYPFLRKCLDYSYSIRHAVTVQRSAIQVASYLYEKDLLEQVMSPIQLTWLREKLLNLSARKVNSLDGELTWLPEFTAKEHLFIHSPLLVRLDEHEQLTIAVRAGGTGGFDREIFALMEAFAQSTDELWILVERYGDSPSRSCMITLASLLSTMSESPNLDTFQIIFSLIEKIRSKSEPVIFANCLSAIQQQVHYDHAWEPETQPPPLLYPFLQYCLSYPEGMTQYNALQLLALLCERELLKVSVAPSQLAMLYESAIQASSTIRSGPWKPMGDMLPDLSVIKKCLSTS